MPNARVPYRRSRQWNEEQAREVLEEWLRSGETIAVFSRKRGLVPERLYIWRKRLAAETERLARSKPVWDELVAWCHTHKKYEQPSSPLGVALRYFTNHHVALGRFLAYGHVPMDNGIVEGLHVRAALTRKNSSLADSGGERAAIAFTILGSCCLAGVDPIEYLTDVLPRLTRRVRLLDLPGLLPWRWAAARAGTAAA